MLDVLDTVLQYGTIMPKGSKRTRGVPELHNELKKQVNLALTPTGIAGLDLRATELGISRSELVERIGRGMLPIALLPSLPFNKRHELPERISVCFITKDEEVLYIGSSHALKQLRVDKLQEVDPTFDPNSENIRIVWVECSDSTWLSKIKKAAAESFRPRFQTSPTQLLGESIGGELIPKQINEHSSSEADPVYRDGVTVPVHFPRSVLRQLISFEDSAIAESSDDYAENLRMPESNVGIVGANGSGKDVIELLYKLACGPIKFHSEEEPDASLAEFSRGHLRFNIGNGEEYEITRVNSRQVISDRVVSKEFLREFQSILQNLSNLLGNLQIIKYRETLEITVITSQQDNQDNQGVEPSEQAPIDVLSRRTGDEPKEIQNISDMFSVKYRENLQKMLNQLKELQNV